MTLTTFSRSFNVFSSLTGISKIGSRNRLSNDTAKVPYDAANGQSLGYLQLPLEIFHLVYQHTDFQSLFCLEISNSRMHILISLLSAHQGFVTHASGFLVLLQRIQLNFGLLNHSALRCFHAWDLRFLRAIRRPSIPPSHAVMLW